MSDLISTSKKHKLASYILVMIILSLGLSISFQSLLAFTLSPVTNPLGSNFFRKNALINENNSDSLIVSNAPLGVYGNFTVGTSALSVQSLTGITGINTVSPSTMLDINGLFRPGNYNTVNRPNCISDNLGMVVYDVDINRPIVCTNTGWLYF